MRPIPELIKEIDEINTANGWRDTEISFAEAMMMLTTECAEAVDAWRDHGFTDMTPHAPPGTLLPPKPQGTGSEFADIAIRLLDDFALFTLEFCSCWVSTGPSGLVASMRTLVKISVRAEKHFDQGKFRKCGADLSVLWAHLVFYAEYWGIDLSAEIERKMAYNRTRGYRHGGRRI